ncbi:MAG: hypothetical protein H7A45_12275, partial [Verrucomicrobiales bacterium]|nr:hypothetical protein [Verrucomicrobiales bacterium]
ELKPDLSGIRPGGFDQVVVTNASAVAGRNIMLGAEGSQLFKVNGKYYLFNITWPRGGMRTVLIHRADNIAGPYEGRVALQDQGVAQGGLVDTPDGSWFAYLFQDHGAVGRIPYLMPVKWDSGWPVLGVDGKVPDSLDLPGSRGLMPGIVDSDEFCRKPGDASLPLVWQWNHNPDNTLWSLTARPGFLRLTTGRLAGDILSARNTLTQRTIGPGCSGVTALDVSNMKDGDFAGLVLLQKNYGLVGVQSDGDTRSVVMVNAGSGQPAEVIRVGLTRHMVYLKAECNFQDRADRARFLYSLDGERWTPLGTELKMRYTLPHFMGYRFGLFNFATKESGGYADFDYFRISDEIAITFTGKVSGDQIRFTRQVGNFGSSEATAKRATATAPEAAGKATQAASSGATNTGTPGNRSGRRGGPDLGPLPEIHEPVPNTLPGLLGKPLKWKASGPLIVPQNDSSHFLYSVKDPTVFRYRDKWEVYATAFMVSGPAAAALLNPDAAPPTTGQRRGGGGGWSMVHASFADWRDAPSAELFYMDTVAGFGGYKCAPEVFYFAPQKKWYYIFQTQRPAYCTSETPDDPKSWTAPQQFFTPEIPTPRLPIDYHCIGDGEHMYLFFTGDDGNFYRCRTTYAEFPKGFTRPVVAMRGTRNTVFEGSFTYKIKGADKYLTCVEALSPTRFYRAYVADTLDGEWYPVEGFDTYEKPFAGSHNVTFEEGVEPWTGQVSHGEMVREVNDERMILDPNNLMFLYQGIADSDNRGDYGRLPYRLGLLRAFSDE